MITPAFARTMAAYNAEMNRRLYAAAARMPDQERRAERGVFWGSLHGTLAHILWADRLWLWRFGAGDKPDQSITQSACPDLTFEALAADRQAVDAAITGWAAGLEPAWLDADLDWYSAGKQRNVTTNRGFATMHFFNHQTHHRGQAHALITRYGETTSDTDLWLLVPEPL